MYRRARGSNPAGRRRLARGEHPALTPKPRPDSDVQEARTAMDILTKSKLVVKRIASGETKQPRIPVTAELLASEVRLDLRQRPPAPSPGPDWSAHPSPQPPPSVANDEILSPESMRLLLN